MTTPTSGTLQAPPMPADEAYLHWRRNMWALAVAAFCSAAGFTMSLPYLPLIVADFGVTTHLETWVGVMVGGLFTISCITAPLWGLLADYYGKKSMTLRAGFGMGVVWGVLAFVPSLGWFLPLFFLIGACNGFLPAALALVASNTPRRVVGRALSLPQTGTVMGTTGGPAVGAWLASTLADTQWIFLASSALTFSAGILALVAVREVHHRPATPLRFTFVQDARVILRRPGMPALMGVSLCFAMAFFGSTPVASLYTLQLVDAANPTWGLTVATWVGAVTLGLTISSTVAMVPWGRSLDRYEPRHVMAISLGLAVLCSLPLPFVQGPVQLVAARVLLGLLAVGVQPAIIYLTKEMAPPQMEARALALGTSLHMLGNGAGPLVAGMIGPWLGLRAYFGLMVVLLAGVLAWWWAATLRRAG